MFIRVALICPIVHICPVYPVIMIVIINSNSITQSCYYDLIICAINIYPDDFCGVDKYQKWFIFISACLATKACSYNNTKSMIDMNVHMTCTCILFIGRHVQYLQYKKRKFHQLNCIQLAREYVSYTNVSLIYKLQTVYHSM